MALKSTFGKFEKSSLSKSKIKKLKQKPIKDIVTGGVTALLGVALLSQTASVLRRV